MTNGFRLPTGEFHLTPKHIKDIYYHALKLNLPLRKMIYTGVENKYNYGKIKAAYFVQLYLIEDEDDSYE